MGSQKWLTVARQYLGQAEVSGPGSSSWIKAMWHRLKGGAWYWTHYGSDDSLLPWCGAFVAKVMDESGFVYPSRYASAKAWLEWGQPLAEPEMGCIVVFGREGGGHVGFVIGRGPGGTLAVLGGNQGNSVSIACFDKSRVLGYRWPLGVHVDVAALPPVTAQSSPSEA
jgi:uncharacterized protein (TIGR02594 family)